MKLKFWKERKKRSLKVGIDFNVLAIPKFAIAKGVLVRITEEGAEFIEEGNLEICGRYVRVEYFPENEGPVIPGRFPAWQVCFNVTLADKTGLHYGNKGVEIVNEVGLPGKLKNIFLVEEDNGRAVVKSLKCPTPREIAELAQEIEAAAAEILDEYRRFGVIGRLSKGKKQ